MARLPTVSMLISTRSTSEMIMTAQIDSGVGRWSLCRYGDGARWSFMMMLSDKISGYLSSSYKAASCRDAFKRATKLAAGQGFVLGDPVRSRQMSGRATSWWGQAAKRKPLRTCSGCERHPVHNVERRES